MGRSNEKLSILDSYGVFTGSSDESFPVTSVVPDNLQPSRKMCGGVAKTAAMVKLMPHPAEIIFQQG